MSLHLFKLGVLHYLKRMSKDPFSMAVYVLLPVVIVYILATIYSTNHDDPAEYFYVNGYNMIITHFAVGMMLLFQLNGGIHILHFLNQTFQKPMKWRLKASPCPLSMFVFSGVFACLIFTSLQGLLIVAITSIFFNAYWGSLLVTVITIFIISFISMLIAIFVFLFVRNLNTAEYVSWGIGFTMATLAGMMFPMPDNAFFRFMAQYGSPFALARSAIFESGFLATGSTSSYIYILILVAVSLVLSGIVTVLSRRRLV